MHSSGIKDRVAVAEDVVAAGVDTGLEVVLVEDSDDLGTNNSAVGLWEVRSRLKKGGNRDNFLTSYFSYFHRYVPFRRACMLLAKSHLHWLAEWGRRIEEKKGISPFRSSPLSFPFSNSCFSFPKSKTSLSCCYSNRRILDLLSVPFYNHGLLIFLLLSLNPINLEFLHHPSHSIRSSTSLLTYPNYRYIDIIFLSLYQTCMYAAIVDPQVGEVSGLFLFLSSC